MGDGRRIPRLKSMAQFLPNLVILFRGLMRDPRVPRRSKILLGVAAAWLVSPIDLIPEFIPVLGPLDDVIVAALVVRHLLRTAGEAVIAEHWRGSDDSMRMVLRIAGFGSR